MRFKFSKVDQMVVEIEHVNNAYKFDYVWFVKALANGLQFDQSEFVGDITDDEKSKLNEMITQMNFAITKIN